MSFLKSSLKSFFFLFFVSLFLYSCKGRADIVFEVLPPQSSINAPNMLGNAEVEGEGYYEDGGDGDTSSGNYNDDNLGMEYPIPSLTINCITSGTSAANIEMISSKISSGVSISPAIAGVWEWVGEETLYFNPSKNWDIDTEYTVTMMPEIFNKDLPKTKRSVKFKSSPFKAQASSASLSREPGEERTPRFIAVIDFNYAVDNATFAKKSQLMLDGKPVKFQITYNDARRRAFIRSEPVEILDRARKFVFISKDVKAFSSKSTFSEELRASATVPDYNDLFYIKNGSVRIVRDNENVPSQFLIMEFSDTVSRDDVAKNVEIYLLPKEIKNGKVIDDPKSFNSYDWYEVSDANKYKDSWKKINVEKAPSEGLTENIHPFILDIDDFASRYILVKFDGKINSSSGFPFKKPFVSIMKIPKYPQELSLTQDGAILSLHGDKILTFSSRGLDSVEVSVGKLVNDEQLQNVIFATSSGGLKYQDFTYNFNETNFASFERISIPLANKSPKDVEYPSVNLSKYVQKSGVGLFFIKASARSVNSVSRIILVTDIAILQKVNQDKSSSVFVMSIKNQEPVYGATVEVIGKNGVPLFSRVSDVDGRVDFPDLSDFRNEKTPISILVRKGGDVSFLPLKKYDRQINYSRFDIGGVETPSSKKALNAFLFSDRGIYRPGEMVQIGGIVKQPDWRSLDKVAVQVLITDPKGNVVHKKSLSLDTEGIVELEFKTLTTSPTGIYEVDLSLMENGDVKNRLGGTSFDVQEFEADTMRVKTAIIGKSLSGWQKPDKVSGYIKVENLYGNPAADRRVKWKAELSPINSLFSDDDYKFTDPTRNKTGAIHKVFLPELKDGKTDANGEATVDLNLVSIPLGFYSLILKGEGFEAGSGDSVYSADQAIVSSLDYLVGYKTLGNLNFVGRNSTQTVDFIAVNSDFKKIPVDNLTYRLTNINYVMSLVKGSDGAYRYQSVEKRSIAEEGSFKISDNGLSYNLPTSGAGRFVFEIYSPSGVVVGLVPFFVTGATNLQTGIEKNAELNIQLSKSEYLHGETIEINIIAPYSGSGLITIEQDKVYSQTWFKATTTSSVKYITVPNNLEGNAYVNVSFIRDPSSKEVFINPHSYGVAPFSIDSSKRDMKIKVSAPSLTISGDAMVVKYSAAKGGKLILFGVDEGILQVAGYKAPNPLKYFMQKKALEVGTYQTVDLILPDYSVIKESFAAGGGEAAIAAMLNPFARKTFKPAVFWSKIVTVEAGKEYEYKYTTPEYFNGTMKVMVVAAGAAAVGSAQTSALVRSPIVLTPNIPYAAMVGDTFQMSVGVQNSIDGMEGTSDIKITAIPSEHLAIVGGNIQTVSIPAGAERTVIFNVKTLDNIGSAKIVLTAESAGLKKPVKSTATISIRPGSVFKTKLDIGKFSSSNKDIKDIFRNMYDVYGVRKVGVSASPLAALVGMKGFLLEYPHGCTEQIVSKIFPLIYFSWANGELDDEIVNIFSDTLNKLRERLDSPDGFSLWSNHRILDDAISIYTVHFLVDAKQSGYTVPYDMMNESMRILAKISSQEPKSLDDARTKAYAIYLLARSEKVVSREISNLEEYLNSRHKDTWKNDLTAAYLGAAYIIMQENEKGKKLIEGIKIKADDNKIYGDYDSSSIRDSIYVYLVAKHYPEYLPKISQPVLNILKSIADGYMNTISSSYAIIALSSVGSVNANNEKPAITAFAGKNGKALEVTGEKLYEAVFAGGTDKLNIKYPTDKREDFYYYTLQSGYDKGTPKETSNNIEVVKVYLDATGNKVSEVKQGDEITVRVRVRITGKNIDYINNVAITDLLAGGLEVIRRDMQLGENYDIREDRVLIYTPLAKDSTKEFTYKVKAQSAGKFVIPPVYAEDMYRASNHGNSGVGALEIKNAK